MPFIHEIFFHPLRIQGNRNCNEENDKFLLPKEKKILNYFFNNKTSTIVIKFCNK